MFSFESQEYCLSKLVVIPHYVIEQQKRIKSSKSIRSNVLSEASYWLKHNRMVGE